MQEKRVPSLLLNILFTQVEAMMGRRSLIMLQRQAGLSGFIDQLPPLSDRPSITVDQYSRLLADMYDLFGAEGSLPVFERGGWLGSAELRRQRPAQFAFSGVAMRFLSTSKRMQRVLELLVEQGEEMYGAIYELEEQADAFVLGVTACPYCAEITQRRSNESKRVSKPVCHIPAAAITEMMEWATGNRHLVQEVACIAMGDPSCRFWVGK
jgi:predicted hydrocarbon binding protein